MLYRDSLDVLAILARGDRYDALRDQGITLENGVSGERTTTSVSVVDRLDPVLDQIRRFATISPRAAPI